MQAQTPPATAKVPNPIYRKLLKAEAHVVIDAIAEVILVAKDQDQRVSQQPGHVGRYGDDLKGAEVKANYQSGINYRAASITEAIQQELGIAVNPSQLENYRYPELRENTSQNTANIQRIADQIRDLADQL